MKNIQHLFNIKPGEGTLVALNFLQALFLGFPRLFTLTAATSLFLANYSANNLPYIYIVSSLIIPIVGLIHLYFANRISFLKLQLRTLLSICLILLSLILLLGSLPDMKWPIFLLLIWFQVEWVLVQITYWSVANRLFTVRQSKRLFGFIWSGEALTFILGGFLIPYLVDFIGTVNLLFFSLGGVILALMNLIYMSRTFNLQLKNAQENDEIKIVDSKKSLFEIFNNRYLLLILILFLISEHTIYFFVDNIFYIQLNEHYQNSDQIAIFLGQFWAAYGFLSLFFRAFISGQWIRRVGLLGGLLTAPITLGICALSIIIVGNFIPGLILLFVLILVLKQFEEVFSGAFTYPSHYTLYQPLSPEQRTRVQTTIELIASPLLSIFPAILLLILNQYFEFTTIGLSVVLFMIILVWCLIIFFTITDYRKALATALKRKKLAGIDLPLNDKKSIQILEQGLKSPRSKEVLYCFQLLEEIKYSKKREILFDLITHSNSGVRKSVYKSIENLAEYDYFNVLKKQMVVEKIPAARPSDEDDASRAHEAPW